MVIFAIVIVGLGTGNLGNSGNQFMVAKVDLGIGRAGGTGLDWGVGRMRSVELGKWDWYRWWKPSMMK